MFGWLLKGVGSAAKGIGDAVVGVIKVTKGDKAAIEAAVADEQLASLASHAAEFAARGEKTKLDSVIDALNRLPRPLFMFFVFFIMLWPYFDVKGFVEYMRAMEIVPETIWTLVLAGVSFYMGGRIIASDLKPPRMTPEQKKLALDIIREREQVILENRTPLIVEVPATRKPPPPPWARQPELAQPPLPLPLPFHDPVNIPTIKGRPESIDKMISDLVKREGGYVNNKNDSGKWTNYGITYLTLTAWRGVDCGEEEVKALSIDEAEEIYRANYYFLPGIDGLPIVLQEQVFDIGVNSGPQTAVKMLQRVLNKLGADIKADGLVGPMTREACNSYPFKEITNSLVDARITFYKNLAAERPKDAEFLRGWLIRARSFAVAA